MDAPVSAAIVEFVRWIGAGRDFGQVRVLPLGPRHELRHASDAARPSGELRTSTVDGLRAVGRHTATGAFRPLSGAPNLPGGWRCLVASADELELALGQLYPGGLADWFAVRTAAARPIGFRAFVERQTGIYSTVRDLDEAAAAEVVRAGCDAVSCLKRRQWAVAGLEADGPEKCEVPCLEPCAVLLEFARRAAALAAEPRRALEIAEGETGTLLAALAIASTSAPGTDGVREGDMAHPANPRRLRLLLGKLRRQVGPMAPPEKA